MRELCGSCAEELTGEIFKIEEGRGCYHCKIAELEFLVKDLQEENKSLEQDKQYLKKQYDEYFQEAIKYRYAFKAVMEELKK